MTKDNPVAVSQEDREAAADYLREHAYWQIDPDEFRSGEKDGTPLVQAIARHRQSERDTIAAGEDIVPSLQMMRDDFDVRCSDDALVYLGEAIETIHTLRAALSASGAGIDARLRDLLHLISEAEMLRTVGDTLADELSVLRHTSHISGAAVDATKDWDALTLSLRTKFHAALTDSQGEG